MSNIRTSLSGVWNVAQPGDPTVPQPYPTILGPCGPLMDRFHSVSNEYARVQSGGRAPKTGLLASCPRVLNLDST